MLGDPVILTLNTPELLHDLRRTILRRFGMPAQQVELFSVPREYYHELVAEVQDGINRDGYVRLLAHDVREQLCAHLESTDLLVQSNLYLRASRPVHSASHEVISWHRESFYGGPKRCANFWMPIMNVTSGNAVRYVPGSSIISDDDIQIVWSNEGAVDKKSAGHKIGLLYAPKQIVGGVDFSTAKPIACGLYHAALFSGELIHGSAINYTDQIRFSLDFRVVAREHMIAAKPHFTSGTDYFVDL